jgi:hypothetical protein
MRLFVVPRDAYIEKYAPSTGIFQPMYFAGGERKIKRSKR